MVRIKFRATCRDMVFRARFRVIVYVLSHSLQPSPMYSQSLTLRVRVRVRVRVRDRGYG